MNPSLPSIIVAYDTREGSSEILRHAQSICASMPVAVHAVLALDGTKLSEYPGDNFGTSDPEKQAEAARKYLSEVLTKHLPNAAELYVHVRRGTADEEIVAVAEQCEAQFIIIGTHARKGLKRMILGSVAEDVIRNAPCPVFVVRPKTYDKDKVEPPCPTCVEKRIASHGKSWWCETHSKPGLEPHVYSYSGPKVTNDGPFILN